MFCVQYIQWTMVISILYQIVRNILDSSQDVYQYLHNYSTRPKRHIFLDFVIKQFSNFTTYISPPVLWCFKLKALKPFPQRFICQKSFNISFASHSTIILFHFRWNPFRKKSGIMGVLYAQSKRNRVVSKHGKLNTFVRPDEKDEQHR